MNATKKLLLVFSFTTFDDPLGCTIRVIAEVDSKSINNVFDNIDKSISRYRGTYKENVCYEIVDTVLNKERLAWRPLSNRDESVNACCMFWI